MSEAAWLGDGWITLDTTTEARLDETTPDDIDRYRRGTEVIVEDKEMQKAYLVLCLRCKRREWWRRGRTLAPGVWICEACEKR